MEVELHRKHYSISERLGQALPGNANLPLFYVSRRSDARSLVAPAVTQRNTCCAYIIWLD
jgi:hypothetical protein